MNPDGVVELDGQNYYPYLFAYTDKAGYKFGLVFYALSPEDAEERFRLIIASAEYVGKLDMSGEEALDDHWKNVVPGTGSIN